MKETQVSRALRIDHSVKFCKRLKLWKEGTGQRESMKDAKMLLLFQNEVGQIVGRRLTRSENNTETGALMRDVKGNFKAGDNPICVVTDNANAIRSLVNNEFEGTVVTKQDPFHVMQRFAEKLKNKGKRKHFYKLLQGAIYSVNGQLRSKEDMSTQLREVVGSVDIKDLACTKKEWDGCLNSNLAQIECGDLSIDDNTHEEGGVQVSIVSTSQLEGLHAALKRLLPRQVAVEVGLRILDIFILEHNLRAGAKVGRNPSLGHADIVSIARAAVVNHGILPDNPLGEFVSSLVSKPLLSPRYRSEANQDFPFSKWRAMFDTVRVDPSALEARLNQSRHHRNRIKELLMLQSTQRSKVSRVELLQSLGLSDADYEAAEDFSQEEFELLRQLRKEQSETGRRWASSPLVTTILFSIVAASNKNHQLHIRRRSYATIEKRVAATETEADASRSVFVLE